MYKIKNKISIALALVFGFVISCKDLDELNINPNAVDPEVADLNFLMSTVTVSLGQTVYGIGFGDISGIMQHTQKTGWFGGYNNYDWTVLSHSWNGYYSLLINNDEFIKKAIHNKYEFHEGVARIIRAYTFGLITDIWGDAPYKEALKVKKGPDFYKPVFDPQKDIYMGILADLDTANMLLSKSAAEYKNVVPKQDVLYSGNPAKWQKFANSLALRYYMRLQAKEPETAKNGIARIAGDPGKYPIITSAADDANISFIGTSAGTSNGLNTVYDISPDGAYMRVKMARTLVDVMLDYNDPRLPLWANKAQYPLTLVGGTNVDQIVDGKREVSQDKVDSFEDNNSMEVQFGDYVGVPISHSRVQIANMNEANPAQGTVNPYVSHLNDRYKKTADPLVLMRLMSAAEVNQILAEAAERNMIGGNPAEYYASGIRESLNAWGVGDMFDSYIANVPYNGVESIIEQKWIASWTATQEAWFDWRRTGLPDLKTGPLAKRKVLPIRWYYHADNEIAKNEENAKAAIERLEDTSYRGIDETKNSAWSKIWVLQGTNKPY